MSKGIDLAIHILQLQSKADRYFMSLSVYFIFELQEIKFITFLSTRFVGLGLLY
jgi:hypothetical protein